MASRFFQLLSGHAAIGPYPADVTKTTRSDKCWRCNSGERQSRHHLFIKCRAWQAQINELWKSVGKVEAPASADRQTDFPRRKSDPGRLTVPARYKVGRMVALPPWEEGVE